MKLRTKDKIYIALGAVVGLFLVTYVAISVYFINYYHNNTIINGKDYSYRTPEQVEKGKEDSEETISIEEIGTTLNKAKTKKEDKRR